MDAHIAEIAGRWYSTGQISNSEKQVLKAQYLLEIDEDPPCKFCETFWLQVRHHFAYQLKALNLLPPVAKSIRKYLIIGGILMLPGSSEVIVNEGVDSEDRKVLTDEMAETILAQYPDFKTLIGINPDWAAAHAEDEESGNVADEDNDIAKSANKGVSAADFEKLQQEYEALIAEHEELDESHTELEEENKALKAKNETLQKELTSTKSQLTKTTNDLAKLKNTATVNPVTPVASVTVPPLAENTPANTPAE